MIKRMNETIEGLGPVLKSVEWSNPNIYGAWLSQAYYIAKQSTSFLGLTLIHSGQYPEFHKRCTAHIAEETGHERLILNDIKRLGLQLGDELPSTSAIYQTQYYRIVAEHPMSFIGYVFLLELLAPAYGPWVMKQVSNKAALTFLEVHARADEDHIGEATKIFELLSPAVQELAFSNFQMTAACYRTMLDEIKQPQNFIRIAA